jgi:hypothetical protein
MSWLLLIMVGAFALGVLLVVVVVLWLTREDDD